MKTYHFLISDPTVYYYTVSIKSCCGFFAYIKVLMQYGTKVMRML